MTTPILITGGAGDIGFGAGLLLAKVGHPVALADIDRDRATERAALINQSGGNAIGVRLDVTSASETEAAITETEAQFGPLGHAVTAAGVLSVESFLDLRPDHWERTIVINLTGTFLTLQAVGRRLCERGVGSMVAVASVAGRGARPDGADYAASKAGVISLVRSASLAMAAKGVRVNSICPGVVQTAMTEVIHRQRAEQLGITAEESFDRLVASIPLGRTIDVKELAGTIEYLLSARAAYVTGQALNVCGGLELD